MSKNSTNNKKRDLIHEAKKRPCVDCGNSYPYYVMDLDHLPQYTKSFSLGKYIQHTLKEVAEEIEKCEVVCANCHRMRTHNRGYFNQIRFSQ
ncbi:HNH endonuclease [Streptomyces phage Spilled]|nr:HNH endonuclease [Streptomyces phage Spilled]